MFRRFSIILVALGAASAAHADEGSRAQLDRMIAAHAKANSIPESMVHRIVQRESRYNPRAVGRGGAMGLMQIKHGTARALGYKGSSAGLLDAETNLTYAVKYLAGAYRTAKGDPNRTVSYYARGYYYAAKRNGVNLEPAVEYAAAAEASPPPPPSDPVLRFFAKLGNPNYEAAEQARVQAAQTALAAAEPAEEAQPAGRRARRAKARRARTEIASAAPADKSVATQVATATVREAKLEPAETAALADAPLPPRRSVPARSAAPKLAAVKATGPGEAGVEGAKPDANAASPEGKAAPLAKGKAAPAPKAVKLAKVPALRTKLEARAEAPEIAQDRAASTGAPVSR